MATASPARAGESDGPRRVDFPLIIGEELVVFVPPIIWYWTTTEQQAVDFELGWDWKSWKAKLTFQKLQFDTNPFYVNAIRHPAKGVLDYQIARANGLGMAGATVFATLMGAAWEYVVEFREDPSINDLITNASGGIAIGEPLWQIGQVWRGSVMTHGDQTRAALFAPFDTIGDFVRRRERWWRPLVWRAFRVEAGAGERRFAHATRSELLLGAEAEVVADPSYLAAGASSVRLRPGAWSSIRGRARFADADVDLNKTSTFVHSRTSVAGAYMHDGAGNSLFAGLGTAFTYDKEALPEEWDRLGVAHLLGLQFQFAHRTPRYAVRLDLASYGDFAMVQAHVFGPHPPFPPAPPFLSKLQAEGYYDAAGTSTLTRLRVDTRYVALDLEASAHRWWQISGFDRDAVASRASDTAIPATPQGTTDARVFWRAAVSAHLGDRWAVAATADGAYRHGTWHALDRRTSELTAGVLVQLAL